MSATTTQDIEFIRDYAVTVARLWRAVTDPGQIAQWFGTEGVTLATCEADFTRTGPWQCVMIGKDSGDRFHVSGQVTHVRPPEGGDGSVGFTWAWHGPDGQRGAESHVIFEVSPTAEGARLRLIHRELPGIEAAQNHSRGWLSTLTKLDTLLSTPLTSNQGE